MPNAHLVLCGIWVESAGEGAVGRDGFRFVSQLRRPVCLHLREVVLVAGHLERDVGDLEVLTLDRYLVILASSRLGGVGATFVVLHRRDREDDVRLVSLESDLRVVLVEVYGFKLQLGFREGLELGKAYGATKGFAKLLDREIHGQYEGVPAVPLERLGKAERAVLVGDAILQVVQIVTELVEDQVPAIHVAGVEHAEVIEHRPLVGAGLLVGFVGVANVEAEGDASTCVTSLLDHILRHLYDHAISIFV